YSHQNIDLLKKGLGVNSNGNLNKNQNMFINYAPNMKQNHPHKIILKDDNYYGKLYDINAESNLPKNPSNIGIISGKRGEKYSGIRRPDSNGVVLPKIGTPTWPLCLWDPQKRKNSELKIRILPILAKD
ncbi:MAG: hypothetical protein II655_14095, partial [Thermoguttaceae bacterium]|nr:hypothetical protein [Thermoguttaceae bacterium]